MRHPVCHVVSCDLLCDDQEEPGKAFDEWKGRGKGEAQTIPEVTGGRTRKGVELRFQAPGLKDETPVTVFYQGEGRRRIKKCMKLLSKAPGLKDENSHDSFFFI